MGFPDSSVGKESTCNARDLGSIPGLGRSPGEGNGDPLQYSVLVTSMDRKAWQATRLKATCTFHFDYLRCTFGENVVKDTHDLSARLLQLPGNL